MAERIVHIRARLTAIATAVLAALTMIAASPIAASAACGNFSGADCAYFNLDRLSFSNMSPTNSDFYLTQFVNGNLNNMNFSGSFIGGANFTSATITNTNMSGMNPGLGGTPTSTLFDLAYMRNVTLTGNLVGTQFSGADLAGVDFSGANLQDAEFDAANLAGANFQGANLAGAQFENANIQDVNFNNTNLTSANFNQTNAHGASFNGATMVGTQLDGAQMQSSDISGALIWSANFTETQFVNASMGMYTQPTTSLGSSWSYTANFFPKIIDIAGYTCATQIEPPQYGVENRTYQVTNADNNDCDLTDQLANDVFGTLSERSTG